MKKIVKYCLVLFMLVSSLSAQGSKEHTGKIIETLNSGGYTYLKLDNNGDIFWAAVRETNVKIGEKVNLKEQVWMTDFKSTTLNRTFDKILFAELTSSEKITINKQITWADVLNTKINEVAEPIVETAKDTTKKVTSVSNAKPETVSYITSNKDKLKDQNVSVIGEVEKVSRGIMNTSWIHIVDSNGDKLIFRAAKDDLEVGDKVKAEGILNTNVDYGYGYVYDLIVIKASFQKQ